MNDTKGHIDTNTHRTIRSLWYAYIYVCTYVCVLNVIQYREQWTGHNRLHPSAFDSFIHALMLNRTDRDGKQYVIVVVVAAVIFMAK